MVDDTSPQNPGFASRIKRAIFGTVWWHLIYINYYCMSMILGLKRATDDTKGLTDRVRRALSDESINVASDSHRKSSAS